MLTNVLLITNGYLIHNYDKQELLVIREEIKKILGENNDLKIVCKEKYSYEETQEILANINEKEDIRKAKGVYYTPIDIVKFILFNSSKMVGNKLKPDNLNILDLNGVPYSCLCYKKTFFDPTCGAGIFLLAALEMKLDLLESYHEVITKKKIEKVLSTLKGNDLNPDSIVLTKIRLLLFILHRYGASKIKGLAKIMETCFTSYDFVSTTPSVCEQYDIIIGNPPYVEDSKSECTPATKYGNIYANVLDNSTKHLKNGGVMGFVIPLSYISTLRMKKIRNELTLHISEQYILSYSDRPDCLFTSVHQKLCIIFAKIGDENQKIYTSNYKYWYKEERGNLFDTCEVIKNTFAQTNFIPKLGTKFDCSIYKKLLSHENNLLKILENKNAPVYLNMRATFWIKAFLTKHSGSEYKEFKCQNKDYANFCMCLLNSSLFWWFWTCVSDCWHVTKKELIEFKVPNIENFEVSNKLAHILEKKLEETKVYVGTKQTKYEYKHKECVKIIHEIDDYINALYELTEEESIYIKNFSYRYRISGGAKDGCN